MIQKTNIHGNERILDIGTGSGYVAIHYAKNLITGSVIGIDKYELKTNGIFQSFIDELKINFFGNTLHNAKKNIQIEKVEKHVKIVKANLLKPFPFETDFFDVIVSSQFLYCIPHHQLNSVLKEIDRVLKNNGKLVFFESTRFMKWNIDQVQNFFKNKGYKVQIILLKYFSNKCIFIAEK
jgi:ubiquinone/menaquinone biosynthesis C-methylase UbiE